VRARLAAWLREVAEAGRPLVAVTHNGVLRAAFSLATGWDMKSDPALARRHGVAHLYHLHPDGRITVKQLNIPLDPELREPA
jgi:probable phosphoglycerate mutase